jgi:hypothetical protein
MRVRAKRHFGHRHVLFYKRPSSRGPETAARSSFEYGKDKKGLQGLCSKTRTRYVTGLTIGQACERECTMNAPTDISMKTDEVLRVELEVFRREHRDLDDAIRALQDRGTADQITLQRLKKKKLVLKDRIALIEDRLTPDIIA